MRPFNLPVTVREVFSIFDEKLHLRVAPIQNEISCKKNCWGCCTIFTGATLPEGVAMAQWLLEPAQAEMLQQFKRELGSHLALYKKVGYDISAYFQLYQRCIFLSQKGACKAYEARPLACRAYLVKSDPKLCEDRNVVLIRQVDTSPEKMHAMRQFQYLCQEANIPMLLGPLPVAVQWGLYYVQKGREAWVEHFLKLPDDNVMAVAFWKKAFESSVRKEIAQTTEEHELGKKYIAKTGQDPTGLSIDEVRRVVEQP